MRFDGRLSFVSDFKIVAISVPDAAIDNDPVTMGVIRIAFISADEYIMSDRWSVIDDLC